MQVRAGALLALTHAQVAQMQNDATMIWHMSKTIRNLSVQLHALQCALADRDNELAHRPVMPPLPKNIRHALVMYNICVPCRSFQNAAFDADGEYREFFCGSCCMIMHLDSKCARCDNHVFVDGLGKVAHLCKECAQNGTRHRR
jgi:hypothetical protein